VRFSLRWRERMDNSKLEDRSRKSRSWNWLLWAGFLLCVVAPPSYFALFVRHPVTRDVPWVNYLLFTAGIGLLIVGLRRAYAQPQMFRGKIFGPILTLIGVVSLGLFCFVTVYTARQLPASHEAPRVGAKAPEFSLVDTENRSVTIASLLATPMPGTQMPPKGLMLVFYRGYW
jgi:MFS family permease